MTRDPQESGASAAGRVAAPPRARAARQGADVFRKSGASAPAAGRVAAPPRARAARQGADVFRKSGASAPAAARGAAPLPARSARQGADLIRGASASAPAAGGAPLRARGVRGQASILLLAGMVGVVIAAVIAGAVARAVAHEGQAQRAADLAAVAAARVMNANYPRLFEPAVIRGVVNPRHLEKAEYLALGRTAGVEVARANGAPAVSVSFPDGDSIAPVRVRVAVTQRMTLGKGRKRQRLRIDADAEAELGPGGATTFATGGGYSGPLAYRQGKPMRPDVAQAFDRMEQAASADGVTLAINSAFRSDAEQAILFARHPDPKWVARPGTSLHRNGTELDLGPPAAYGWLAANATRFHFTQRYSWEAWHYGFVRGYLGARAPEHLVVRLVEPRPAAPVAHTATAAEWTP